MPNPINIVENILPPNVYGKSRGFLEIEIIDIQWKTLQAQKYKKLENSDICIKFVWWGEKPANSAVLFYNKTDKLKSNSLQYNIQTNCKLFHNYLTNCEPLEIKLTTKTSHLHIGSASIKIPIKTIKNCFNFVTGETIASTEIQKYNITNKGSAIGDITIKFKMLFFDPISARSAISSDVASICKLKSERKNIEKPDENSTSKDKIMYKKFQNKAFDEREQSSSLRIINFLSGRQMSRKEEELALQEIHRTSPLNNVVIDDFSLKIPTSSHRESDYHINFDNINEFNNKIDSIRLHIKFLKLLPPGIRQVYVNSLINTTFTIECKISPNLLDDNRSNMDFDVMRFYSNTYDDKEQRIDFNKEAIRSVKLIYDELNPFIAEHAELLFTVWWREYGSRYSRCLGTTKFRFTSLFQSSNYAQIKKLRVKSCTGDTHVADLICKVTLGTKDNYFGQHLTEKIIPHFPNNKKITKAEQDLMPCEHTRSYIFNKEYGVNKIRETPNSKDNSTQKDDSKPIEINNQSSGLQQISTTEFDYICREQDHTNVKTSNRKIMENFKFLQGLLYVGAMRNVPVLENGGYFIVCRAFWKEDATSSDFAQNDSFNFFEMFPVMSDENFLERVRNNHLVVELWQKTAESQEKLAGIVRLPLHQFFIAFRDSTITNHLCKAKLPVISIDGWSSIVSPLSGIVFGQLQTLLCIGTEDQLEYLKTSRGFNLSSLFENCYSLKNPSLIPVPELPKFIQQNQSHTTTTTIPPPRLLQNCDAESQTSFDVSPNNPDVLQKNENDASTPNREKLSDILGSFLENLTQRLPPPPLPENHEVGDQQKTLRRTSDLLDVLQKALVTPPPDQQQQQFSGSRPCNVICNLKICKILLDIECALHLPRNPLKIASKKNSKRNKGKQSRFPPNEEPSAYVTFQAEEGYGPMIKSHEGMVYATNVVEKCSNPSWGKRFEVAISSDYLLKDEKRFILRVWKKAATDLAQCRLLPTPMEDSIIGFSSIDLTVLMARMPCISGWFNIVDFNGRVNGQIKITIQPLEDVLKYKILTQLKPNSVVENSPSTLTSKSDDLSDLNLDLGIDLNNASLSRAFKRKITELEEITHRLRARLLDVTGEADPNADIAEIDDAQMDEFERDLNTACNEDENFDMNVEQNENFGWLQGCHGQEQQSNSNKSLDNGSFASQERVQMISDFLRNTEINEIGKENIRSKDDS